MKSLRLLSLLDRLHGATSPLSAEVLARALEVSPRTIYRDMVSLQALGAPVRGESGLGYQLEAGYVLPPLHFDPDEMEAIMLGIRMVTAKGDQSLARAAERASAKISATLQQDMREYYKNLPLGAVSRSTEELTKANQHLSLLRRVIRTRTCVQLTYLDLKNGSSQRLIRPLGLTLFDAVWLLTAWCESRNDFRNFRLDRIRSLEITRQTFRHERGRRFQDYLKNL